MSVFSDYRWGVRRVTGSGLRAVADGATLIGLVLMWIASAFCFVYGPILALGGQVVWGLLLFLAGPAITAAIGAMPITFGFPFAWLADRIYPETAPAETVHDRINRRAHGETLP